MAHESVLRICRPQQNPGFAGVLRFGENQGAVREGCDSRKSRAKRENFRKVSGENTDGCWVLRGCGWCVEKSALTVGKVAHICGFTNTVQPVLPALWCF
jgi:hypothetical protein